MIDKLVVNVGGAFKQDFTSEELAQRELDRQQEEEQALLDSIIPTAEEVKQSEFNIMGINLLMEVGLL